MSEIDPINLFYSYSHKDESLRDTLEIHLKIIERQNLLQSWHDRAIDAGTAWKDESNSHLANADIIVLLISSDFIASDYCWDKEMTQALAREAKGEACVIPIIVRSANWESSPIGRLQVLPKDALAVESWPNQDEAWTDVSKGIEKAIKKFRVRK